MALVVNLQPPSDAFRPRGGSTTRLFSETQVDAIYEELTQNEDAFIGEPEGVNRSKAYQRGKKLADRLNDRLTQEDRANGVRVRCVTWPDGDPENSDTKWFWSVTRKSAATLNLASAVEIE